MSGPIHDRSDTDGADSRGIVVRPGRQTRLGGMDIDRVLPTKGRRTVGPWCFVDLMSPGDIDNPDPMEVGPHPHIGLSTVTWLFAGEALHGDSLGTEQIIKPGELNLMTAGAGIAHAELGLGPATGSLAAGGTYRPLTELSIGLDYLLWGQDAFGYHLINLLWHVVNSLLCYLFVRVLVPPRPVVALTAAVLFSAGRFPDDHPGGRRIAGAEDGLSAALGQGTGPAACDALLEPGPAVRCGHRLISHGPPEIDAHLAQRTTLVTAEAHSVLRHLRPRACCPRHVAGFHAGASATG